SRLLRLMMAPVMAMMLLLGSIPIAVGQIVRGDEGNFITLWKTDNPGTSDDNQIVIPALPGPIRTCSVYWESADGAGHSGSIPSIAVIGALALTFPEPGTYRVEISGPFPGIYFNNEGDRRKILDVLQWGDVEWVTMANAFYGASNL